MSVRLVKCLRSMRKQQEAHPRMQRSFRQKDTHEHGVHREKEPAAVLSVEPLEAAQSNPGLEILT